ncbi:hypothetical protein V8F20_012367 [Naviculisporaceae sp. PSN 640]
MQNSYSRPIPIPLRLQASTPPTESEIISRQDAWCEWVWKEDAVPYKNDDFFEVPFLRAVPQWNQNDTHIPAEQQIHNLLVKYTRKMHPKDVPLIADNPDLQGYKVRMFSSSRYNVHYLLMKDTPGRTDIPEENAEPIMIRESDSTCYKFWPATKTQHSSYDRLIRVKMPWAPYYAVENEVANMLFAAQNSRIRVPDIYCFDSSGKNTLGLDFIVMERIPGLLGGEVISAPGDTGIRGEDQRILRSVRAQFRDGTQGLIKRRFDNRIGSLYCNWGTETLVHSGGNSYHDLPEFFVGPLVDPAFFGPMLPMKSIDSIADEGLDLDFLKNLWFSRGPFHTTEDYLTALTNAHLLRDWSQLKPCSQSKQHASESPEEEDVPLKTTATSLRSASLGSARLRADMHAILDMAKRVERSRKSSGPSLFAGRFSPADLRPESMILTEQGVITTSSSRESPEGDSRPSNWKWYRLRAVTEWDTARVMPFILSRHGLNTIAASRDEPNRGYFTDGPATLVHLQPRPSRIVSDGSTECARMLRGLEQEIGWLCTVEMVSKTHFL